MIIMKRIIISLFFILTSEVLNNGNASKEHVHFRIHVPEIVNHQVHTKTVFIHIHEPEISKKTKPKVEQPKKTYHKSHENSWSSWNAYGYHSDHDENSDNYLPKNQQDYKNSVHETEPYKNNDPYSPQDYHRDSYMPEHNDQPDYLRGQQGDMRGYSYPPQYAVHEDVKERRQDNNDIDVDEPYIHTYEEGYHKGGESASGRTYTGDLTKFYDDKHEEGDHSTEEYKNESKEKTHAGRYFVDDYQRKSDKYEAERRVSPKMFAVKRRI